MLGRAPPKDEDDVEGPIFSGTLVGGFAALNPPYFCP
jgi:hypothetical protein